MHPLHSEAIKRIEALLTRAQGVSPAPAAMALATATREGHPSVRTVDLAGIHQGWLAFFVNQETGKGAQLRDNPQVGLCFHWPELKEQLVVEGQALLLPDKIADRFWSSRSRHQALQAWTHVTSDASERFQDVRVPRPDNWVAYGVAPWRIEFWRSEWRHAQDRVAYLQSEGEWHRSESKP